MGWSEGNRRRVEQVQKAILEARNRGVCNLDGESVKVNGVYVAKPRNIGAVKFHKVYPRRTNGNL